MNDEIKAISEIANTVDHKLYIKVMDLENHMNDCECDDAVRYYFHNIIAHHEHCIFCLNCGGIIEYED